MWKVLLIGDVWEGENGRYHIGDESMFLYNYKKLRAEGHTVYVTSRSISHPYVEQWKELLAINFYGYIWWKIKLVWLLGVRPFLQRSTPLARLVKTIQHIDIVVISWWWNLNSIWPGHLYFRFLVAYLAQRYGKKVFLAGQTLWPIQNFFDTYLLHKLLKWADLIGVRDRLYSCKLIPAKYISKKVDVYDDACQPTTSIDFWTPLNTTFTIGYSLHAYEANTSHTQRLKEFIELLDDVTPWKSARHLLPHVFNNQDAGDLLYMKQLIESPYEAKDYKKLLEAKNRTGHMFEELIEWYTWQMNLLVTTRYHGAVFALKQGVIPLMIYRNNYEKVKFEWLMDSFNLSIPSILFTITDNKKQIEEKLQFIFLHYDELSKTVQAASKNIDNSRIFINYALEHDLFSLS